MEIAEKGPARARELKPDPSLLAVAPLPESERDIDHAGLIAGLDHASFERGEAIYNRVCINCHGTKDRPGSLPTSLRFASGSVQERRRPVQHVSHADPRFRPDDPAKLDGAEAEVRRDPLHPGGLPEALQSRPVWTRRPDVPGAAAQGKEPRARAGRDPALGHDGLRAELDGDL